MPAFQAAGVEVYGLSPDPIELHKEFAAKHQLNFPLLADIGHQWIDQAGLWQEQEWNGKKYTGVVRTTLLVGSDGRIAHLWEKVKFQDHAAQVLEEVRSQ